MFGLFSAIKAGAKALLGIGEAAVGASPKGVDNVMKVATGVGKWIDELKYTDEERAVDLAALSKEVIGFVSATKDENTERSITRRNIAIWIMRAEVLSLVASGVVFPLNQSWSEYLFRMANFDAPLGWMACGVGVFFFGTHMMRARVGK